MEVLHYIMPVVRYKGGYPWGREPGGFSQLAARLTELPDRAVVPVDSGHRPWRAVKSELEAAFGHEDVEKHVKGWFGEEIAFPVEIVGDWLVREGSAERFSSESIRVFDY